MSDLVQGLPLDVREALVAAVGDVFFRRETFKDFLIGCRVPRALYSRHADKQYKRLILRGILKDLQQMGDEGWLIQRRIVSEFCALKRPPEVDVDPVPAARALHAVRALAREHDLLAKREHAEARERMERIRQAETAAQEKRKQMDEIRTEFYELVRGANRQARGYALEKLIAKLFRANGLKYRGPFPSPGQQLDGAFTLDGFDYLVEAKWRREKASPSDVVGLMAKVDSKFESTRGLFVSMAGFTDAAIAAPRDGRKANVILMDGDDLTLIIEGWVGLLDGLKAKIRKAAQEGITYYPLRKLLNEGAAS